MKAFLVVAVCAILILVACSKNKFETTPKIEIKSYNTKIVPVGGRLVILMNYFDKEGDLGTGGFWAARYRSNLLPLPPLNDKADTLDSAHGYSLPDFPNKDKGEISLELDYSFLKESLSENDTIFFRIAITDKEGNESDTLTTDKIVILL